MLRKNPGFTAAAVLTLALGIGANAAIFSIVNAVLLDPFPYKDQHQLVQLLQHRPKAGVSDQILHAGTEYLAYREQPRSFVQVAAVETVSRNITVAGEEPERLFGAKVSADFFTMLDVNPVAGCTLRPEEQGPGNANSVVIGQGFWQRRFGGDSGIIGKKGKKIELDGEPFIVVGVMPARFRYRGTEFWFPFPFELAVASHPPFWFTEQWSFAPEGQEAREQRQTADYRVVSPDYHRPGTAGDEGRSNGGAALRMTNAAVARKPRGIEILSIVNRQLSIYVTCGKQ